MAAVARRPEPRKFLDASLVPLERALRARAAELEADGVPDEVTIRDALAVEFRALADELHHW